jgi:hypothetical protein
MEGHSKGHVTEHTKRAFKETSKTLFTIYTHRDVAVSMWVIIAEEEKNPHFSDT